MDPGRWTQVKTIFQDVFEREPAERAARLAVACGADTDLQDAVQRLLLAHTSAGSFLDSSRRIDGSIADGLDSTNPETAPERIGPYRIIRELGRGGMGTVYLAERDDPGLRKTVAIKVVQMASRLLVRRFRNETQILAALEHPGIARLYDGGATDQGLPYFVMEYVDGGNLLAYSDARQLAIADRLRLFRRVCEAVQFAHQNFIVHRDLKPSNILVTPDGDPKLLDFGIAKLLGPELAGAETGHTELFGRMLTPQYSSPEHVRGEAVTTASDVYSLGVILYELLCGQRPYRITSHLQADIERAVCEQDPQTPSVAAANTELAGEGNDVATTPAVVAERRATTARQLRRELSGDLDTIVLKALQKEPGRRYATAADLADDIKRYLDGFPVRAIADRRTYRAAKFLRRHRAGVVAAGVAGFSLIIGLGFAVWQARVARLERDRARIETVKARQMATFLGGVFQGANPVQARGKTVTARELLDQSTASIGKELMGEPDVQASLLLVMADAYFSLTVFDRALDLAEQSLAIRQSYSPHTIEVADSLDAVGQSQRRLGRNALAVPRFEQALALREELLGRDDPSVAHTLLQLELARGDAGRTDGNLEMLERAIRILERATPASAQLAYAYNVLGIYFDDHRDLKHARTAYERSIAVYEKITGAESWGMAMPLVNLGDVLRVQGNFATARPLFERALAIDAQTYGNESQGVAYVLARLGDLSRAEGDLVRARELLERSLAMYAKTLPADHYEVAEPLRYLGETLLAEGKPLEALPVFERALRLTEQAHGAVHTDVAEVLLDLGRARGLLKEPAQGEPLLRRALAIQRGALAADSQVLVPTLTALGELLAESGKTVEARGFLDEAVKVASARLPERHSHRLAAEAALRALSARADRR